MGGAFSGYRDSKKRVVESCDAIDTSDLKRLRLLRPGTDRPGSLEWRRSGDEKASVAIGYTISVGDGAGTFRFRYQIGQSAERFDYPVQLVTTVCHLGGRRWWFVCPLAKAGVACGRRVRKLYRCGHYFGCRHCHELVYRSSQQSDARVYALARAGVGAMPAIGRASVSQLGLALKALTLLEKRTERSGR